MLVKQDQADAKSNVEKRLEFIRGEMYVAVNIQTTFSDRPYIISRQPEHALAVQKAY